MQPKISDMEQLIFEYIDKIKAVISADLWSNILLNCTKNEVFVLLLLYREKQVNMSRIAEYVNVPLNTATGIVDRMERRSWVYRQRSPEDKRVVTIVLAEEGLECMKRILQEFIKYGIRIFEVITPKEADQLNVIFDRIVEVLYEMKEETEHPTDRTAIKKIEIE